MSILKSVNAGAQKKFDFEFLRNNKFLRSGLHSAERIYKNGEDINDTGKDVVIKIDYYEVLGKPGEFSFKGKLYEDAEPEIRDYWEIENTIIIETYEDFYFFKRAAIKRLSLRSDEFELLRAAGKISSTMKVRKNV